MEMVGRRERMKERVAEGGKREYGRSGEGERMEIRRGMA